jgi:hypothetical protein
VGGATILAEGIETEEHVRHALELGATLGQGWHFGRPGPLPLGTTAPHQVVRLIRAPGRNDASPFTVASNQRPMQRGNRSILDLLASQLLSTVELSSEPLAVISSFPLGADPDQETLQRYVELTGRNVLTALLVPGRSETIGALRTTDTSLFSILHDEWTVVTFGPHHGAALVARPVDGVSPANCRYVDYVLTHDRPTVLDIARQLLSFLEPAEPLVTCA